MNADWEIVLIVLKSLDCFVSHPTCQSVVGPPKWLVKRSHLCQAGTAISKETFHPPILPQTGKHTFTPQCKHATGSHVTPHSPNDEHSALSSWIRLNRLKSHQNPTSIFHLLSTVQWKKMDFIDNIKGQMMIYWSLLKTSSRSIPSVSRRVHSGGPDRTAPQRLQPVSAAASSSRAGARQRRTLENGESV